MPFVLRPYRRFPVVNAVTYEHGWGEGPGGLVWNLPLTGWQLSGNLPLICLAAVSSYCYQQGFSQDQIKQLLLKVSDPITLMRGIEL